MVTWSIKLWTAIKLLSKIFLPAFLSECISVFVEHSGIPNYKVKSNTEINVDVCLPATYTRTGWYKKQGISVQRHLCTSPLPFSPPSPWSSKLELLSSSLTSGWRQLEGIPAVLLVSRQELRRGRGAVGRTLLCGGLELVLCPGEKKF